MKNKKSDNSLVLFFGPYPPKYFGQSIAFKSIVDQYEGGKVLVNYNWLTFPIISTPLALLKSWFYIFLYPVSKVYITTSRTNLGFIRDALLIYPASLKKIKIINHLHGADFKSFYQKTNLKSLVKLVYNKIDTSIVLLDAMRDQYEGFPKMNIEVIPNSASIELENYKLNKIQDGRIRILYLSNIIKSKGVFELLEAAKLILESYENVEFHFAGDFMKDEFMSKNEAKSTFNILYEEIKLKYHDKVFYHGVVLGIEKMKLLELSDVFCLPTYYKSEAFPISILEAMLFENAILVTNFNYLNKLVSNENGMAVIPKNVNHLVVAIKYFVINRVILNSIQNLNRNLYFEMYSNNNYIKKVLNIINF